MGIIGNTRLGVLGLFGMVAAYQYADLKMNYTQVDAVVTIEKTDCFVKHNKEYLGEKNSSKMAYMDCDVAKLAVVKFGFKPEDIHKRQKLSYKFESPVDGSTQVGKYEDEYSNGKYKSGQTIKIYAHTSDAKSSRWS